MKKKLDFFEREKKYCNFFGWGYLPNFKSHYTIKEMHPKFLLPVETPTPTIHASTVLGVPIGGAGAFPLGLSKTFAQQFVGNQRANLVFSLTELLFCAANEARLDVYFVAVPEWSLFSANNFTADTPETTSNFMLYYIMLIIFPTEDAEIVFKGVVARLMSENSSMQEQKPILGGEDEEMSDRRGAGNNSRKVLETPRVKVGKFGLPAGVA